MRASALPCRCLAFRRALHSSHAGAADAALIACGMIHGDRLLLFSLFGTVQYTYLHFYILQSY